MFLFRDQLESGSDYDKITIVLRNRKCVEMLSIFIVYPSKQQSENIQTTILDQYVSEPFKSADIFPFTFDLPIALSPLIFGKNLVFKRNLLIYGM